MKEKFLFDHQIDAVKKAFNGCIFNGGVGSGKSRTGLFYYFKECGGWIDENGYVPMSNPKDLYIITTAAKRDKIEGEEEVSYFLISPDKKRSRYSNNVVIDSWNNIKKYVNVVGSFFIFDEDRVTGKGVWVKSFLKISKNNNWIILSATPGDKWEDYIPVFIANGFYKNKTEFSMEHLVYSRFAKYPKVERYINTSKLNRLKNKILIDMDFDRHTIQNHIDIYCNYDIKTYKEVFKNRWDIYKDEPIQQASSFCYVLRRIVNSDISRENEVLELLEKHPKAIIFYNFDYELLKLKNLDYQDGFKIAEWNGHSHESIPNSDKWVYLVQYTAGCEGWNTIETDTIIFFSQNYSYKTMIQAAGRIDRLNTPFTDLYYYHLKSHSGIDLAISRTLKAKKNFNEKKFYEK